MGARLRSWLEKIVQHPFIATGIVITLFALIAAFTFAVYKFGWNWTGFNGGYSKVTTTMVTPGTTTATPGTTVAREQQPAKTLWDVLQLLIVPLILAIGGFWLNRIQTDRDKNAEEAQKQRERESREDNQRETALQTYIDRMSELLLKNNLRNSA